MTKMITVRTLREQLGEVWDALESSGEVVVTSNGKPIAVITPTSENSLEQDLRAIRQAKAAVALGTLQTQAVRNGTSSMTAAEIDAEIQAVRRGQTE
jgi:prevent-host-death family protein